MKLLFLTGDQAVGKMTVGQELAKITELRLLHNHMTIEPVWQLFGYKHWPTIGRLREVMLEEFAASEHYGLIYTNRMNLNSPHALDKLGRIAEIFTSRGAEIYYVELSAPLEVRLQRNATENRFLHKPSKKIDHDEAVQSMLDETVRCISRDGEIPFDNFMRIENMHITADETARMIKDKFSL